MYAWTDARVEQLTTLWNTGEYSCSSIAARLGGGVTRNAVIGKALRLGLAKKGRATAAPRPKRDRSARTIRKNGTGYVPKEINDNPPAVELHSLQEVEAQPKPTTFLGIPLLKLQFEHCRYPRDVDGVTLFCGQPKLTDSSYCRECHARCHTGSFGTKHSTFVFGRRAA